MEQHFEREYMDRMRRRYAKARTRADKTRLIDEAILMCKRSRKFVIRVLNGSYRYHPHRCRPMGPAEPPPEWVALAAHSK